MFKISADTLARFLMALWTTCGRLNHRPLEWNKGKLEPLYKRGDPEIPRNHRPICLLSAARKIIERAVASAMNESFTPHRAQMGFQKHMGTEMALAQMHRASNQRQNWITILDLNSAYDRVCRATLMKGFIYWKYIRKETNHTVAFTSNRTENLTNLGFLFTNSVPQMERWLVKPNIWQP